MFEDEYWPHRNRPSPKTTKGRISSAIQQILWFAERPTLRAFSRSFDDCFEAGDGDAVVKGILAQARQDARLSNAIHVSGHGYWFETFPETKPQASLF